MASRPYYLHSTSLSVSRWASWQSTTIGETDALCYTRHGDDLHHSPTASEASAWVRSALCSIAQLDESSLLIQGHVNLLPCPGLVYYTKKKT
jgi:hypothetical protein